MSPDDSPIAVIVAHPDDETLWAGGTLLMHPEWRPLVAGLCRASDPDRAPRFRRVLDRLHAEGGLADLDDGPEQGPLEPAAVEEAILSRLPLRRFRRILTHGPRGEYTRHRRHEEVSRAVAALWAGGALGADELWMFAYDDDGRRRLPEACEEAHHRIVLPPEVWRAKYEIVTAGYGFAADSWEARATPRVEAFWRFESALDAVEWSLSGGYAP